MDRRDGAVVRASALQSIKTILKDFCKMVSRASLLGAQHLRDVVKNKPASSFVVFGQGT